MQPIRTIESRTVVIPVTNIDTDQIIPARFLTTTTREGLGKQAFADWRYEADGQPRVQQGVHRQQADPVGVVLDLRLIHRVDQELAREPHVGRVDQHRPGAGRRGPRRPAHPEVARAIQSRCGQHL